MQNPWSQRAALLGIAGLASFLLGCSEPGSSVATSVGPATDAVSPGQDWEMQWAQAALERNPNLEILSADRDGRVFTVRDRNTAMTTDVQLAQIAAAPLEFLTAQRGTAPSSTPVEPAPAPVAPPTEPPIPTRLADTGTAAESTAAPSPKAASYVIERSGGRTRVIGEGISVVYDDAPSSTTAGNEQVRRSSSEPSRSPMRITAPGVSIEPSDAPGAAARRDPAEQSTEAEPVICEGPRVLQLDSRTIKVEGDALTARGGCELYITNSTIVASGTAVVIGDATVHINNSRIAGGLASFDANERAKVFLRGSTLNGLPRRSARALVQDQGGNSYQ